MIMVCGNPALNRVINKIIIVKIVGTIRKIVMVWAFSKPLNFQTS